MKSWSPSIDSAVNIVPVPLFLPLFLGVAVPVSSTLFAAPRSVDAGTPVDCEAYGMSVYSTTPELLYISPLSASTVDSGGAGWLVAEYR